MTERSQLFQSSGHVAGDRWTGKDGVIPVSGFNPVVVLGYQQPTTYPPTESPAQGPLLPSAERTSCMYPPGMKNGDVDLPVRSGFTPQSLTTSDSYSRHLRRAPSPHRRSHQTNTASRQPNANGPGKNSSRNRSTSRGRMSHMFRTRVPPRSRCNWKQQVDIM